MTVTVIGVSAAQTLSAEATAALRAAELVVGSGDNLSLAGVGDQVERVELGPLAPAIERLRGCRRPAAVVASGDPGLFGIVRALQANGIDIRVLPAVSSVAAVFARLGLPWDDAVVVSAHGRELGPALNACRAFPRVAVLTGPGSGAVQLARGLRGWDRDLVVAERLGLPGEQITRRPAAQIATLDQDTFAAPNVVVSLGPAAGSSRRRDNQPAAAPEAGWALPEVAYAHRDSMITKAEVRAYAVARLRPRLGRLILDVGAGSGSVGIECAALGAAVLCVERDADACRLIADNAERHGVSVRVIEGSAPAVFNELAVFDDLPDADAAFVGGGGVDVVQALSQRRVPTVVAAFAALDTALAAYRLLAGGGYRVEGTQLSAARLSELPSGSLRLAALNPVVVLTAELA